MISDRLLDLSGYKVDWLFRSGEYSSYDVGIGTTMLRYPLSFDQEGQWHYNKDSDYFLSQEAICELIIQTGVADVEEELERLPKMPPP